MDAKATVKIGPFARGGTERVPVTAADHEFRPEATVTPVGLFLPRTDELFIDHRWPAARAAAAAWNRAMSGTMSG